VAQSQLSLQEEEELRLPHSRRLLHRYGVETAGQRDICMSPSRTAARVTLVATLRAEAIDPSARGFYLAMAYRMGRWGCCRRMSCWTRNFMNFDRFKLGFAQPQFTSATLLKMPEAVTWLPRRFWLLSIKLHHSPPTSGPLQTREFPLIPWILRTIDTKEYHPRINPQTKFPWFVLRTTRVLELILSLLHKDFALDFPCVLEGFSLALNRQA
jgi:hypothetical protein